MSPQKKKQPVNFQNSFSFVFRLSQGQSQNTCLHFNTASWAKLRLSWHVASSVCACVCSTSQKTLKILLCCGLNYGCREKLHLICICTNGMWAVWRSVSPVSAVRQHCVNTNRYNTQHRSYTPCVSLNRTADKQTACSTVLLEKPKAPQPVSKYGTGRFIAVCTIVQHFSLT